MLDTFPHAYHRTQPDSGSASLSDRKSASADVGLHSNGKKVSHQKEKSVNSRPVFIASSSPESNVQGLLKALKARNCRTHFLRLPYNDLDTEGRKLLKRAKRENPDMQLVLCHSVNNRRFAITNAPDALYDRFLPDAASILGKDNIGVIVHDLPPQSHAQLDSALATLKDENKMQTAFENSAFIQLTTNLEESASDVTIARPVDEVIHHLKPLQKSRSSGSKGPDTRLPQLKKSFLGKLCSKLGSFVKTFFVSIFHCFTWLFTWPWRH